MLVANFLSVNSPAATGVFIHASLPMPAALTPHSSTHDVQVYLLYKNVPLPAAVARCHSASLSSMKEAKHFVTPANLSNWMCLDSQCKTPAPEPIRLDFTHPDTKHRLNTLNSLNLVLITTQKPTKLTKRFISRFRKYNTSM